MTNKRQYFEEHIEFLRTGYQIMNVRNLTVAFNEKFGMDKPESAISTLLYKNKITCGRKGNDKLIENRHKLLTKEQDAFVRASYKQMPTHGVTDALNKKFGTDFVVNQIEAYINNHRILSGRTGCFEKGNTPWNNGTKGHGLTVANPGSFKPGNVPATIKPLYYERLSKDKLIEIKVPIPHERKGTATQYMPKQRWVYEQHHGPIPDGYVVSFLDGDRANFEPENLIALSRAEMLRLNQNGYRYIHDDLKPSVLVLSRLQAKASEVIKDVSK